MNEIKTCSLAGISFTLEKDAHTALADYIASLQNAYRNDPDGEEIIADIEARIAELILSAVPADAIVTKPLVLNIIKQLGSAEEIENEQPEQEHRQAETTDPSGNPRIPRRLYRDLQHRKLGGVCAGLAHYFNIDATLIRLAMFIPLVMTAFGGAFNFLNWMVALSGNMFGLIILTYIIMWFAIPPASTARQKLEMMGERITTDSIRENVQNATPEEQSRTIIADIVNIIGKILLICLKIVAAILLIGLVVGVCVLGMVALAGIPMLGFNAPTGIALIAFFGVVMLPLLTLIYLVIMLLISMRPKGRWLLVMLILWIISLTTMTISAIKSPARFDNSIENLFESVFEHDEEILYKEFTQEEIDQWRQQQADSEPEIINSDSLLTILKEDVIGDFEDAAVVEESDMGVTIPEEGITKHIEIRSGSQRTSCNINGNHVVMFTGDKKDVEQCKESIKFEPTRICFSTKKGDYSIEHDGRAYNEGKRIEDVSVGMISDDTEAYCFEVDDVKVKYFSLENFKLSQIIGPAMNGIFESAGSALELGEGILNIFGDRISADEIEEAKKAIQEAREELNQEREEIRKELRNLNMN